MANRWPVVEIFNPARRLIGSGVLLGERLVLTARHVVQVGPTDPRCSARMPSSQAANDWCELDLCWAGAGPADDIAMLEFRGGAALPPAGPHVLPLGRVDRDGTDQGLPCSAVGFPVASVRPDGARDPQHLLGRIGVGSGPTAGQLVVTVDTATASLDDRRDVAWAGMSGAALVAHDHVVGVLTRVTTAFVGKQLAAVPVTPLLGDPEVRRLLVAVGAVDRDGEVDVVPGPLRLELEHRRSVMLRPPTLRPPLRMDCALTPHGCSTATRRWSTSFPGEPSASSSSGAQARTGSAFAACWATAARARAGWRRSSAGCRRSWAGTPASPTRGCPAAGPATSCPGPP